MKTSKHFLNRNEMQAVNLFVKQITEALGKNLLKTTLFGSKVAGNFDAESDIDILVLLKRKTWQIRNKICELALEIDLQYKVNLSPVILSEDEFAKNEDYNTSFSRTILESGIVI